MAKRGALEAYIDLKDRSARGFQQFNRNVDKSTRGVGTMNKRMVAMDRTAQRLKRTLGGLFVGVSGALVLRDMVQTISGFERTMATVRGVTGATGDEFAALTKRARDLGATTEHTAQAAGEGLLFLARAGFDTQQSLDAVGATLNLATAGALELGQAADYASNIVTQFGLAASETERVVDTLLNTSNSSNTSVLQLAEALKMAGPVAGALGRSVEETAAAIGTLGDAGIQATLAGTNLRGMFAAILKPTDDALAALDKMGLTIQDLDPTSQTIYTTFQKLGQGLDSLSTKTEAAQSAVAIFGRRNVAAALTLTQNIDKVKELTEANEVARGEAERMAEMMQDTLAGAFKTLRSTIEELYLSMGDDGMGGALRSMTDTTTEALRVLMNLPGAVSGASKESVRLAAAVKALAVGAAAFAAAGLASSILKTATALATMNSVLSVSPVTALVRAVGGLAAAYTYLSFEADSAADAIERQDAMNLSLQGSIETLAQAQEKYNEALKVSGKAQGLAVVNVLNQQVSAIDRMVKEFKDKIGREGIDLGELFQAGVGGQYFTLVRPHDIEQLAKQASMRLKTALGRMVPEGRAFTAEWLNELFSGVGVPPAAFQQLKEDLSPLLKRHGKEFYMWASSAGDAEEALSRFVAELQNTVLIDKRVILAFHKMREELKKAAEDANKAKDAFDKMGKGPEDPMGHLVEAMGRMKDGLDKYVAGLKEEIHLLDVLNEKGIAAAEIEKFKLKNQKEGLEYSKEELDNLTKLIELRNQLKEAGSKSPKPKTPGTDGASFYQPSGFDVPEGFAAGFKSVYGNFDQLTAAGEGTAYAIGQAFQIQFFDPVEGRMKRLNELIREFALNFLNSLNQIAAQAAAMGLLKLIGGAFSTAAKGPDPSILKGVPGFTGPQSHPYVMAPSAKGNVFSRGEVVPFASGGVVTRPTVAPMALFGETGPEAIMPLKRGPGGRLGVEASGGGGDTFVYSPTIHAMDATGVSRALAEDKKRLDAWWNQKMGGSGRSRRQVAGVRR